MRIINLTPHEIVLRTPQGDQQVFPASGSTARLKTAQYMLSSAAGVPPVAVTLTGGIEGLPEPQEGVVYLVSSLVAQAAKRSDVWSPDTGQTAIRENGQIVAVTRFQTFAEPLGVFCEQCEEQDPAEDLCPRCEAEAGLMTPLTADKRRRSL